MFELQGFQEELIRLLRYRHPKTVKKQFVRYWLPVCIYAGLIFCLSSIPQPQLPRVMPLPDYLLHFLEYLPFGFLLARAFKNTKKDCSVKKAILYGSVAVVIYALSDEFHQWFVPGRNASLLDIASDTFGALVGMRFLR